MGSHNSRAARAAQKRGAANWKEKEQKRDERLAEERLREAAALFRQTGEAWIRVDRAVDRVIHMLDGYAPTLVSVPEDEGRNEALQLLTRSLHDALVQHYEAGSDLRHAVYEAQRLLNRPLPESVPCSARTPQNPRDIVRSALTMLLYHMEASENTLDIPDVVLLDIQELKELLDNDAAEDARQFQLAGLPEAAEQLPSAMVA